MDAKLFPLETAGLITAKIRWRGRDLEHRFEPPTAEDWLEYDRLCRVVMTSSADMLETDSMADDAAEALWAKRIREVAGYGELPEDWRDRVPLSNKTAAIAALAQVAPAEGDDVAGDLLGDETTVRLEAVRSGVVYEELRHTFRRPTTSQEKEYSRRMAKASVLRTGGVRKGGGGVKAFLPSQLEYLIEFYDRHIVRVEGYEPAEMSIDDIKGKVDALHKRVAVEALMGNAAGGA